MIMQMVKNIFKLIRFLLFIMLAVMLTGCKDTGDKTALIKAAASIKEDGVSVTFPSAGKIYRVKAVNTMETYMADGPEDEKSEYYIYQILLMNGKGEILQQFDYDCRDEQTELYVDDMNFDGFPDLEITVYHDEEQAAYSLYLWDSAKQQFSEKAIDIPCAYKVHKDWKVFSLINESDESSSEVICRLDERGRIVELRSYMLSVGEKLLLIYDNRKDKYLVKEKIEIDQEGQMTNYEDYQYIFWSDLIDSEIPVETYFSAEIDDYKVSFMDLIPGESLKLEVSRGDHDTTIVRVFRKEMDYESPDEFSVELFKNLLGHNGFCLHDNFNEWFRQTYYYGLEGDELLCLADSFGFEPDDHIVDIDGDGDNELICNLTYGGDGAARTIIYHYDGERVLEGNLDFLLDIEYDDHGTWSTGSSYLSDKNVVRIWFWLDNLGDFAIKDYKVDLERIDMMPYGIYKIREEQNTRVSTEFISDGKTYTITAVSIGKTYKEGDAVYTVYEICLTDENRDRIQSFYSNMIDDYIDFSFDDLNFDGYPDMQILYFHWKRGNNLRHLYLWDNKTETFSENVIELETDYEICEEKKAFIMKEIDTGGEEIDTLCRINAKGEMERTLLTGKDSNDGE